MKIAIVWALLTTAAFAQSNAIVPQPVRIDSQNGTFSLPQVLVVNDDLSPEWRSHLELTATHVSRLTNGKCQFAFQDSNSPLLQITRDESLAAEEYLLAIAQQKIQVSANSLKGLAHATATLMQLIGTHEGRLPLMTVRDAPQLPYRNFMIDMGRNPHSLELLKETIDLLWFYKVDSLQLHLTDDQRFAFPSTAYPKLWDGLISVDQFRELEAYAVVRGVTIIPEFEVPGHSGILRSRYPEVFGKTATDLARNETALVGIKTLLDEMMDVFASSPYIHIGGDEAFGVPETLQRNLINKLHAYLKSHGRQTLVWEGPRPGRGTNKVNKEVIHLNWRTINYPADKMLKDGYRVVNAAWDPLYIVDHYPRINFTMTSPQHIYETMKLTRFKHVNPSIRTFERPIQVNPTDRLIGFCMPWWEGRESNYFAQNIPRLIPFAEVAWNPSIKRDFAAFTKRTAQTEVVRQTAFYPVQIHAADLAIPQDGVFHNSTTFTLTTDGWTKMHGEDGQIRFTLDGSVPTSASQLYEQPISLTKSATVRAALFVDGQPIGHGSRRNFTQVAPIQNLALNKPVTSSATSAAPFSIERLTDGGTHFLDFYLGYPADPQPISVTIDLQRIQTVGRVVVHAYSISNSFEKYTVEVSQDGESFEQVATRLQKPDKGERVVEHPFDQRPVRYVRINSQGNKGYVFDSFSKLTEIQVFAD